MTPRFATAADICAALRGHWNGTRGRCRCPVSDHSSDPTPLSVAQTRDGRPLIKCFAGCDQLAVIAALRSLGLWGDGEPVIDPSYPFYYTTPHSSARDKNDHQRRMEAMDIWDRASPAAGTAVEAYLRARGIRQPVSDQLRYHPRLKHDICKLTFRAMVARIADNRGFCAIQRTFLDNKEPRKADIPPYRDKPGRAKLGMGPQGYGAVRLRMPSDTLGLAEGIETALSAAQIYHLPVWATLSAHRLGKIEMPDGITHLAIFGDSGDVGREQAFLAADEYERRGYKTEVIFPAADHGDSFKDYNDVVRT